MSNADTLHIVPKGDHEIADTREFDAPRSMVFDAYTKPELLKRWLLGPDGWSLIVCDVDLRVGGKYRWVWEKARQQMGMGGVYREIVKGERIVATERFDEAWYPGEGLSTITFTERGGKTLLTTTLRYESKEARDMVLKSGMEHGMKASYARLDGVLSPSGALSS